MSEDKQNSKLDAEKSAGEPAKNGCYAASVTPLGFSLHFRVSDSSTIECANDACSSTDSLVIETLLVSDTHDHEAIDEEIVCRLHRDEFAAVATHIVIDTLVREALAL